MDHDKFVKRLQEFATLVDRIQLRLTKDSGGPEIESFHVRPRPCADCGLVTDHAPTRLITYRNGQRTIRCLTCKFLHNPETGQFDKIIFVRKKDDPPSM